MAELSKADYEGKYNHATTGLFKDNTTEDIEAVDVRAEVEDTADSFVNRLDEMALVSVSTAGATIILDFGNGILAYQRRFVGSASFATPKTIDVSYNTNANYFSFIFNITDVAATLTFDATFISSDPRWSALTFTSLETGIFKAVAYKSGPNWLIDFSELPYV
jgi:hypothetical protein